MSAPSPTQQFAALHELEQNIIAEVPPIKNGPHSAPKRLRDLLIDYSGRYSAALNVILKQYATVDYHCEPTQKAVQKAIITYAYDILDLFMKILRLVEKPEECADLIAENVDLLLEFVQRKEELLNAQYYPQAKEELKAFYDPAIREALDSNLKRFLDKHQPRRPHRK